MNKWYATALYVVWLMSVSKPAVADPPPTVPLTQGAPAPFTGVLFTESEMVRVLDTVSQVHTLSVRNTALEANIAAITTEYTRQLGTCRSDVAAARTDVGRAQAQATLAAQRTWWEQNGVWVTLAGGLLIGTGVTTAVFLLLPRGP